MLKKCKTFSLDKFENRKNFIKFMIEENGEEPLDF